MKKYSTTISRKQLYDLYMMLFSVLEMQEDCNAFELLFKAVLKELLKEFQSRSLEEKNEYKFTFSNIKSLALLALYRHYDFDQSSGYNKLQQIAMELEQKFHFTKNNHQSFITI